MLTKKLMLAGTVLGTTLILGACGNVPKNQHAQALSTQQAQYEQQKTALEQKQAEYQRQQTQYEAQQAQYEADRATYEQKIQALQAKANQQPSSYPVANATTSNLHFPPNAQPGHCYSRVVMPAKYKTKTQRVMVKQASESISIIPAKYKNVTERVIVTDAAQRTVVTPATYKTVSERVLVKPAHTHQKTVAATYKIVSEQVLDQPAHTAWKRGAGFQSSALETRIDNGTGDVMCLVEIPATYKTLSKTVIDQPARTTEIKHAAEYNTITKRVIDRPETTKTVTIPAVYKNVLVKRLITDEQEVRKAIPAVYKNITSSDKVVDENVAWAEVLCESNMTNSTVLELQKLLTKAGTYKGPVDGDYGPMTERAVNNYAKKNGLPTGSRLVSVETAKHIGLHYKSK